MPEATFTARLRDEMSGPARAAARSVADLKGKIEADTRALGEMEAAMRRLKGGSNVSASAIGQLKAKIDAQKNSLASSQEQYIKLGGAFGDAKESADEAKGGIGGLTRRLVEGEGAANVFKGAMGSAGAVIAGATGIAVGLAAAFVAMAAAVAKTTYELGKYAVAQSDARRAELLRLDGLNSLDRMRRRYTASAGEMQSAIDRVSDRTNVGRDALGGYARQLARAGLQGVQLQRSLEAMGMAAQVQGEEGARRFLALTWGARGSAEAVANLADRYKQELGPIARRQMLSIDNQTSRFRKNLSQLFSGLNLEGFLGGLKKIGDLFSQSTVTGRALKQLVETIFQPMIDQVGEATPMVVRFFQQTVARVQRGIIWWLELRNTIKGVVDEVRAFGDRVRDFFGFGQSAGQNVGKGLAAGLDQSKDGAVRSGLQMARGLAESFRAALGIRSPSRVFAGFGSNITAGVVKGMDPRAVEGAARHLANRTSGAFQDGLDITAGVQRGVGGAALEAGTDRTEVAGTGLRSSSVMVSIGDIVIQAGSTSDPEELASSFTEELARALRGLSIEMGAA